ncbi:creatininase family protein [Acidisoma cellulosilytica]|uniref:Creatininase family protein n=1 Tax=Acidisoma cellulosilyticum TaxID=2802395 RepID=A0A963Z3A2_9PROT|nr:creatininase family protein [Acidisoma cellulosilyticum]MCB8881187.1 creatininase family protein [Acidisoma cellulosilyticum]
MTEIVAWAELKPAEFIARRDTCPVVYLPLGLCEPHGHVAPFGLDTIKADYLVTEAARRFGGIVAPTMAYHIHETGYHAPWLRKVMGGVNPLLAALPPHLMLETLLYQLRAFHNAGFQAVVVISGHNANQADLRMVAEAFAAHHPISHFVRSDPELVAGRYQGDHAGRYELSQLLHIRPDLVAMDRASWVTTDPLGRFAQNPDVTEATAAEGKAIVEASIAAIGDAVHGFALDRGPQAFLPMAAMEPIWAGIAARRADWVTLRGDEG